MDASHDIRRILVNKLIGNSFLHATFANMNFGGFLGPVFTALAKDRREIAISILEAYPDDDLSRHLIDGVGSTELECLHEAALRAIELGEIECANMALAAELESVELFADLPPRTLNTAFQEATLSTIHIGIDRLSSAIRFAKSSERDIVTFSTRRAGIQKPARPKQRVYDVFFGTNRASFTQWDGKIGFSADYSDTTTLGMCSVTIPRTHKFGEGKPNWWRRYVEGAKPLSLESVLLLEEKSFWQSVRDQLYENGALADDAIIFLHGYNVRFEDAAICAAQIGADLNLPGAMAFFSWPSHGKTLKYPADEASIEASETQITKFLTDFSTQSGARQIHLIAHSMGNRGLLRAVNRIASNVVEQTGKPFGQIILAAPDVDRRTFQDLCPAYPLVSDRTTLYISDKDLAVRTSRFLHSAERVGLAPPVTIAAGIDTVSVTKVDLSFLGHGYVASCAPVLTDIHQILTSALAPSNRARLTAITDESGTYWELAG